ncbi:MAG: mitochondrial inner membrane protein required for protein import [Tremellales sp. Tagirdzhanova-0007]|nr:MAG: mitochondrial inner membrane protein required for protein import [Tremellales sp. Tagirdzhanova-0007]
MVHPVADRFLITLSHRSISTSSRLFVKARYPPQPHRSDPSKPHPSPAERPPPIPQSISTPPPVFDPIVNSPATPLNPDDPDLSSLEKPRPSQFGNPTTYDVVEPPLNPPLAPPVKPNLLNLPSLDIDPSASLPQPNAEEGGERRRTGAGRKEYVSSIERQRRAYFRFGLGALILGGVGAVWWSGREDDTTLQTEGGVSGHLTRVRTNFSELFDVNLEGLLVSSSWDRTAGWRTAKRPGVDYFLAYLSQFYEIVLFTSQPLYTAAPVAEKLDPYQAYLPYKLFRDSTRSISGKTVKDLSYLNRDLSKVILLDTNAEHAALQPENSIIVQPWEGKGDDKGLVQLIPFLESIGIFSPADVRPVLKAYQGKDIPNEYAKNEAESKRVAVEEWNRLHPSSMHGAGSGFLSSVFGSVAAPGQSRPNQPMTYLEQKRAQAQRIYQEEQKYWADHADEFKKLIEEDKQKQMAEMKGSLMGYLSGAGGVGKLQEPGK